MMDNKRMILEMPVGISLGRQDWKWDRRDGVVRCNRGQEWGNRTLDTEPRHEFDSAKAVIVDARVKVQCFASKIADDYSERHDSVVNRIFFEAINSNAFLSLWMGAGGFRLYLRDLPSGILPRALLAEVWLEYDPEQGTTYRVTNRALWSCETSVTFTSPRSGNLMGRKTFGFRMFSHFLVITDNDHPWTAEKVCGNSSAEELSLLILTDEREELYCPAAK